MMASYQQQRSQEQDQQSHQLRQSCSEEGYLHPLRTTNSTLSILQENQSSQEKLKKWNDTVSDDNIVIHVVEQVSESDWFTKKNMTEWENNDDRNKSWDACKLHFKWCYITCK